MKKTNQRIKELDGIRGVAILIVVVWHYIICPLNELPQGGVFSSLHFLTTTFWSGVDLFLVLSGFLIGGIIMDNHNKNSFLKVFWIRRVCRIFPVFFLLLILCWTSGMLLDKERFSWLFSKLMPWWTYASFTQNIAMGLSGDFGGHFLGITWSLAIEEQFYLFAPLLILVVGKKTWVQALIPLVLLAFIFRLASPGFHSYVNVVFRMDSLLLGVFVAVLYRNEEIWRFLLANRSVLFAAFLCLLLITGGLCLRGFGYFKIFWFALLYGTFLVVSLLYQSSRLTWILRTKFLCFWGSIAYGLYLYHQAVSGLLHGWLRYGEAPSLINGYAASVTGLAFILSTTLAWVSFVYFEAFFLKLGKRQRYGANKSAYATPTGSP